jgi:hypothetical protein
MARVGRVWRIVWGVRATLVVVGGAVLLALPLGSFGQSSGGDTWSGTWDRTELPGKHLFLTQTGSMVSGHYDWNDASGTVSGTVSGATLTGSFTENHYQGTFTLTLSGKSFSGSYTATNRDTGFTGPGPFNGTCSAGPCQNNGAPGVGLSNLSRKVEIQVSSGPWQKAAAGQQLHPGDKIHSGFKAGVTLTFPDGSTLVLNPLTLVLVNNVAQGPDGSWHITVTVLAGNPMATINRSRGSAADFNVKTPTTTTSVRGTSFSVLYYGSATIVSVFTDSVTVTPNSGSAVIVPAGMEVVSTTTSVGPPSAIGRAGAPPGSVGPQRATALVSAAMAPGLKACNEQASSIALRSRTHGWLATVPIIGLRTVGTALGKPKGTAIWNITGTTVKPSNSLARKIKRSCR